MIVLKLFHCLNSLKISSLVCSRLGVKINACEETCHELDLFVS